MATALIIGETERAALADLRARAGVQPINVREVVERLRSDAGDRAHRALMDSLSVRIPLDFLVTLCKPASPALQGGEHVRITAQLGRNRPHMNRVFGVARELGLAPGNRGGEAA